jgi:hypothetical protein
MGVAIMIDKDAVQTGDTITYTPPRGQGECTATVEYTTFSAVHVITSQRRRYPVIWPRVISHTPRPKIDHNALLRLGYRRLERSTRHEHVAGGQVTEHQHSAGGTKHWHMPGSGAPEFGPEPEED